MRPLILGVFAALFFASTFVLNEVMQVGGGSFAYSASLRFLWMIPLLLVVVAFRGGLKRVLSALREESSSMDSLGGGRIRTVLRPDLSRSRGRTPVADCGHVASDDCRRGTVVPTLQEGRRDTGTNPMARTSLLGLDSHWGRNDASGVFRVFRTSVHLAWGHAGHRRRICLPARKPEDDAAHGPRRVRANPRDVSRVTPGLAPVVRLRVDDGASLIDSARADVPRRPVIRGCRDRAIFHGDRSRQT